MIPLSGDIGTTVHVYLIIILSSADCSVFLYSTESIPSKINPPHPVTVHTSTNRKSDCNDLQNRGNLRLCANNALLL